MELAQLVKLARPHGSLVRADLVPDHLSASAWTRLHGSGILRRVHPGVSRLTSHKVNAISRIEAATFAVPDSLAAGPSAAWLWGSTSAKPDAPVHLEVADRAAQRPLEGVRIHRPTDVADLDRSISQHIATVKPMRAVLGVAAWTPEATAAVVEELVVARKLHLESVEAVLERHGRPGVPGIRALRHAYSRWVAAARPPDSVLEARMMALLRKGRLPEPEFQIPIGAYRVDFAWTWLMATLECDGWEFHGRRREDVEAGLDRDAVLEAQGWVVWHYSWSQIVERPTWVIETLHDRIAARAAQLGVRAPG